MCLHTVIPEHMLRPSGAAPASLPQCNAWWHCFGAGVCSVLVLWAWALQFPPPPQSPSPNATTFSQSFCHLRVTPTIPTKQVARAPALHGAWLGLDKQVGATVPKSSRVGGETGTRALRRAEGPSLANKELEENQEWVPPPFFHPWLGLSSA